MEYNTTFLLGHLSFSVGGIILWIFRLFCVLFTFITWKKLKWGVFLICAFLPAYLIRFNGSFDLPMTALELMILILFSAWVIKRGWKNIDVKLSKNKLLLLSAGLFLLSATISIFISPDIRAAAGIWKAYFIEPILFLVVFLSVIKKKDLKWVIFSLGFSAFYISLYAIGQKLFGLPIPIPWQEEMRATSIFPFPNAVGLFLAPIVPLLLWQAVKLPFLRRAHQQAEKQEPIIKIFLILTVALSIFAIIFAKSEGALVALVVGALFFGIIYNKISRKITILIILLGLISCFFLSNTAIFSEIKTKLLLQDWSGKVRLTMWSETWELLKNRPLGVGLSGYQAAIIPHHESSNWMEIFLYPHNIIFNFWSEVGLLGLISFLLLIICFYKTARKSPVLMTAMTVLLVHGLVDVPYFKNDLSILFWVIIGISLVLCQDSQKSLTK